MSEFKKLAHLVVLAAEIREDSYLDTPPIGYTVTIKDAVEMAASTFETHPDKDKMHLATVMLGAMWNESLGWAKITLES
jgi:hypothetical protein